MRIFDLFKREPVKPPVDPPSYAPVKLSYEEIARQAQEYEYFTAARQLAMQQHQYNQMLQSNNYQNALSNGMVQQTAGTYTLGGLGNVATPEGKIKDRVKKALDELDVYYTMPLTSGYGNSGVPDILACVEGRFFGIECKAGGNKVTALQEKNLKAITDAGGCSLVIDETNVDNVTALILAKRGELK